MKKWFFILCVLSSLWACNDKETPDKPVNPVVPEEEVPHASLTILAYFVANNNLDDDLLENIGTMYDGLSKMNQPATLLIYWDGNTAMGPNKSTHHILKYEIDEKGLINDEPVLSSSATLNDVLEVGEIVKEYPEQLSTQKSVMSQVLKDMVAMSPTERLGFVAGSHASSWINSIYTSSSRSFGQDGSGTDNTILLKDMVDAIKSTNKKFDFILFDACYMATAEVNYEFREVADYLISSVMEVPAYGFPYDETLPHLYAGEVEEYQKVCQAYIDYYTDLAWGTISLIDCTGIMPLTQILKQEIVDHKEKIALWEFKGIKMLNNSSLQFNIGAEKSGNYQLSFNVGSYGYSSNLIVKVVNINRTTNIDTVISETKIELSNIENHKQVLEILDLPQGRNFVRFELDDTQESEACYLWNISIELIEELGDLYLDSMNDCILLPQKKNDPLEIDIHDNKLILSNCSILENPIIDEIQEYGRTSGHGIAYDLEHLVKTMNDGEISSNLKNQLEKTVLYKGCIEKASPRNYGVDPANYCGIGIYIPVESHSKWNQYLKTIEWYTISGWNEVDFIWD